MSEYLYKPEPGRVFELSTEQIAAFQRQNQREARRGERMTASSYRGENYWNQCSDFSAAMDLEYLYRDPLTAGMQIEYPHGVVLRQPARSSFFRGENQLYEHSVPTLLRRLNQAYRGDAAAQELYRMVADMRIYEFKCLLEQFEHVQSWSESDVLYDVLAQHYGLETCWMDMTSDFDVALFFACCYYDAKAGAFRPLTREQTEQSEQTRWGVIYHMPAHVMGSRWDMELDKFSGCSKEVIGQEAEGKRYRLYEHPEYQGPVQNLIYPIGFQPFMRCSMQSGYGIYMREFQPLQSDMFFQRLKFRHSQELSERIFDAMGGGEKIYPHEGLNRIQFLIDDIAGATDFSRDAFRYALFRSHAYRLDMEEQCLRDLERFSVGGKRVTVGKTNGRRLSGGKRRLINQEYADFSLYEQYHILPLARKIVPAGAGVFAPYMLPGGDDEPGVADFKAREMSGCTNLWTISYLRLMYTLKYAKAPEFF